MTDNGRVDVVVLGAGVIGLTNAMLLSKDKRFNITIIAKHMPGDYDIEYASPWAGANYLPVGKEGSLVQNIERNTFPELKRLANDVPEAAIHFQDTYSFSRKRDSKGAVGDWTAETVKMDPWWKDIVSNFRILQPHELPPDHDNGTAFTSVCINTAIYLPWLLGQCLKNGVIVRRGIATDIGDAASMHHSGRRAAIVINCTGLGALKLGGVEDAKMFPARGQIVVVRNDPQGMFTTSGTNDGEDEVTYIMHRAAGGGTILGGCLQHSTWESQPCPNLALRIMKRSLAICPALGDGKGVDGLSVIRHGVGLRPMREGGPRMEKELIDGIYTVHCYGHGGYGYQSSYGSAYMVKELVNDVVKRLGVQARL